jgi:hypothetical protein
MRAASFVDLGEAVHRDALPERELVVKGGAAAPPLEPDQEHSEWRSVSDRVGTRIRRWTRPTISGLWQTELSCSPPPRDQPPLALALDANASAWLMRVMTSKMARVYQLIYIDI